MPAGPHEAETRAEPIDPALAAAGGGDVAGGRLRRAQGLTPGRLAGTGGGRRGKPLTADYVLVRTLDLCRFPFQTSCVTISLSAMLGVKRAVSIDDRP
jgi:hypothetical protein